MYFIGFAEQLEAFPLFRKTMFADRTDHFHHRLGWCRQFDAEGFERDYFDEIGALYIGIADEEGRHQASLRLLPMTGETMLSQEFGRVFDLSKFVNSAYWECTRFCVSRGAKEPSGIELLYYVSSVMPRLGIDALVATFDRRMLTIYRRLGVPPKVVETSNYGDSHLHLGVWNRNDDSLASLSARRTEMLEYA